MLARYCDDITWVLENLNEASRVAALEHQITMHQTLAKSHSRDFDATVLAALGVSDHSKLYTYFIDDLVTTSKANQSKQAVDVQADETNPLVALSPRASRTLTLMIEFLESNVFSDERIEFRNRTLKGIIATGLDILYTSYENEMPRRIERAARLDGSYSPDAMKAVHELLKEPVHRVQASVDLIASMSDREVFELVGLE